MESQNHHQVLLNGFRSALYFLAFIFSILFLLRSCSCSSTNSTLLSCRQEERDALIRFKQNIDQFRLSWEGQDCCEWRGITCDEVTRRVVKLELNPHDNDDNETRQVSSYQPLEFYCSTMELGASLVQLRFLNHLDLGGLYVDGCHGIPEFIGSMKQLRFLDLPYLGYCGTVPPHLGNLTNLEFLALTGPSVSDSDYGWISRLVALKYLDLSYVNLEGAHNLMGVLSTLPSLSHLTLLGCQLGNVHLSHVITLLNSTMFLSRVRYLDLSWNLFDGQIPSAIQNMSNSLTYLDMSYNRFNSSIPAWFGRFENLHHLNLSRNNLDAGLVSLPTNLKELDLSDNRITENIPRSLGRLRALKKLDLRSNRFNGAIPDSIGQLSSLEYLDLSNNSLEGVVSEDHFSTLSMLKYLDFGDNNHLIVNVETHNWKPPFQLTDIRMGSCDFGMQSLRWIRTQRNASTIILSNCSISGDITELLDNTEIPLLHYLDLSHNHITGTILSFSSILYMDLSHNRLSGAIPTDIGRKSPRITSLLLNDNLISGPIPPLLCDLSLLEELDLANNQLSGSIPDCWTRGTPLKIINLSANNLSGVIPRSIATLSSLTSIHMNKNNLRGELPEALGYLNQMTILDLGENNLSGDVPPWIGETLLALQIMRLRDNKLYGIIPYQLCAISGLQLLDLAGNNLEGKIPACFGLFHGMGHISSPSAASPVLSAESPPLSSPVSSPVSLPPLPPLWPFADWSKEKITEILKGREMEYTKNLQYVIALDLSRNKLIGSIPEELTLLTELLSLNLSYNALSGDIPEKIGSLKLMESLDLSNNQLSGTIPQSISDLTMLSHMSLANNSLSGRILKSNQLDTVYDSDHSIYSGNPLLCGEPLLKLCPGDHYKVPTSPQHEHDTDDQDVLEKLMFYVVVMLGFLAGFWGVIGALMLNKSWRAAYFKFAQAMIGRVYVAVKVKVAMFKRSRIKSST